MVINTVIAFVLDLLIGDPHVRVHPVRLIGRMLDVLEGWLYPLRRRILGGALLVVLSMVLVTAAVSGLVYLSTLFDLPLGINVLMIVLVFFLFCNRDMVREAKKVSRFLDRGDLEGAREQVARIVGRDTRDLDRRGIIRATVESVAESIVDGFTAPLFYLVLGGPPLAYAYKTVNTIDSRFGYRSVRYEQFGKAGARLDDVLNFLPARLNALVLIAASGFRRDVFRILLRDGRAHPSPNSGLAEAGFAGHLGLALGGPSLYGGVLREKPWIGENRIEESALSSTRLIDEAIGLYWRVVSVTFILALAALLLLGLPLLFRFPD
jgi:adenosylcobinamide-phosphate synthase